MTEKTERNALYRFLEKREIKPRELFDKRIMLRHKGGPIPLEDLNRILANPTIHISKENFERLEMAYTLTGEERSALQAMVTPPVRYYKRTSTKYLRQVIFNGDMKKKIAI